MLIPAKEGPGNNNIDIYMCPLIHELKLLWKGVNAFDFVSMITIIVIAYNETIAFACF